VPIVRKWVGRFLAQGDAGLRDASSQGGAIHSVRVARMGVRHPVPPLLGAHVDAQLINASLQLAPSAPGIGGLAPVSRLSRTRNNLLTLHKGIRHTSERQPGARSALMDARHADGAGTLFCNKHIRVLRQGMGGR
jgi:hypothetical protein